MRAFSESVKDIVERLRLRSEDPEFQRRIEQLAAENVVQAAAQAESERKLRLMQGGVPMSTWDGLKKPNQTDAIEAVRSFLTGPPSCCFLVLSGARGRGKTFALSYAVERRGGCFIDAQKLVFLGTFDPVWKDLEAAPLLALDEIGAEYRNDAFYAQLYALLNARYANLRKTVIGTNLNAPDFKTRYPDERLIERLRTGGTWVNLAGESMRTHWSEAQRDEEDTTDADQAGT